VPVVALAQRCRLGALADGHLSVPSDKGANAGRKVMSLVAGMVAGADSIDDMALLRHGAMGTIFDHPYAPSTLGSSLRAFTFGHVRQLDAVAARGLSGLAETTPVLAAIDDLVFVDVDDTIIEVHGHSKQGSGYGYSGVRGLNALAEPDHPCWGVFGSVGTGCPRTAEGGIPGRQWTNRFSFSFLL